MKPISLPLSITSTYLIRCEGGFLQVDTGYDWDYPRYRRGLAKAGIELEEIRYVFLTHHHDDHAGFLARLMREANFTLICHQLCADFLPTGQNDADHGGGYLSKRIKFLAGLTMRLDPGDELAFPPCKPRPHDVILQGDDSDALHEAGVAGTVLFTPGHSVDHMALVLDDGTAFPGDAAANTLNWAGAHYATVFMTDMDEAYRSWHKLIEAGARRLYPAHGRPFDAAKLGRHMGKLTTDQLVGQGSPLAPPA